MTFDKPYTKFTSVEERDIFLKKYGLLSQNPRKDKTFFYKGRNVSHPTPCLILGYEREYESSATLVIDYGCGTCFINSDYLKQMQQSKFSVDDYNA